MNKKKILLVDDERDLCTFLKINLELESYEAKCAYGVDDAIRIIENEKFDIIVSDIRLEGKSGLELLKYVKNDHPEIDVIMMTGFSHQPREKILGMGAKELLIKPFDPRQLIASFS